MTDAPALDRDAPIRARVAAGDLAGAMSAALETYGHELHGVIFGLTGDADHADDVFSATCERLWRGLPGFRWDCTFQVWAYTIARNEFRRSIAERVRARQQTPLSEVSEISALIERVRSTRPMYMRTETKSALARVREQLDPDDHLLLGLRLERGMAWNDIARVLGAEDAAQVAREAAALRKRFERLKVQLRELLRDADA